MTSTNAEHVRRQGIELLIWVLANNGIAESPVNCAGCPICCTPSVGHLVRSESVAPHPTPQCQV